jgi:hypothetical protein
MSAELQLQSEHKSETSIQQQLEKILHSSQFHGSELLRNLLVYLTRRTIDRPGEAVKEYDLAVDVLGRDPGFDPRVDSAVRVHTSRLRAKLAEYYMSEGVDDPYVLEVPKGSYLVSWRRRNGHPEETVHPKEVPVAIAHRKQALRLDSFVIGFAAAALLGCAVWFVLSLSTGKPAQPLETFWRPFVESGPDPIVAFSNHRFVGTSASGLRVYHEGLDSPSEVNDTYSGTGTVMAVDELNNVFAGFHRTIRLKRAELLTWDEARATNLIFVGSPESNSHLRQLPPLQFFDFKSSRSQPKLGVGGIVNLQPKPGEAPIYYGSGMPYTSDYAVIAMFAGLDARQRILILAGTNTYGVQAAAEFISRPDRVSQLLSRLAMKSHGRIADFEALISVRVNGGVPVDSQLVIVRLRQNSGAPR